MDERNKEFVAKKRWDQNQSIIFFGTLIVLVAAIVFTLCVFAPVAIIFIFGVLAVYYMFNAFKAEYAYTISQKLLVEVLKKSGKRKKLAEFFISDMTLCAPYGRAEYKEEIASADNLIDAATDRKDPKTYFAVFERDNTKTVLLFSPSEMMLNELDKHTSHKSIR